MIAFLALIALLVTLAGLLLYQWQRADRLAAAGRRMEARNMDLSAEVARRGSRINDLLAHMASQHRNEQAVAAERWRCGELRAGMGGQSLLRWN